MTLHICTKKDASNKTFSLVKNTEGPQLNWIERGATDSEVEGSSPSGPAKKGGIMSKRYSGKSFKDSSLMKRAKLSLKEKRKLKKDKKKNDI